MIKKIFVVVCAALLVLALTGCSEAVVDIATPEQVEDSNVNNGEGEPVEEISEIVLYFMKSTETEFIKEAETREVTGEVGPERVVQELLKGPEREDLERVIPEGTVLRGIKVEDGIAYVDFSCEIAEGHYGSEVEGVLLDTIVWTLTELPEIEAVQILVEGEKVETLGGHICIEEPLTR